MTFIPDYNNIVSAAHNRRPARLPLYEHIISPVFMEKIIQKPFAKLENGSPADLMEFFRYFCGFFVDMTYDTVSYEVCVTNILPGHGAIMGGKKGPIQNRADFDSYPWNDLPRLFWELASPRFQALEKSLPPGVKAVGGVGNGIFEVAEDLVGFEYLSYMQIDDPKLFSDLFERIGDLMAGIWQTFLNQHASAYCLCRMGDDLGFKTSTMLQPHVIKTCIVPQYKRIIDLVHQQHLPFLLHSCGRIFDVMDDIIAAGINAKHSNEDAVAPYQEWIDRYSRKIGLFGGIDVDLLCTNKPATVYLTVLEAGARYRAAANGYALGSGNSIPDYIPADNFLAMIDAAKEIRRRELQPK
jgi:uroporphyrinogen decarboxylase